MTLYIQIPDDGHPHACLLKNADRSVGTDKFRRGCDDQYIDTDWVIWSTGVVSAPQLQTNPYFVFIVNTFSISTFYGLSVYSVHSKHVFW